MIGALKRWLLKRQLKKYLDQLEKEGQLEFLKAFFGGSKKATAALIGLLTVLLRDVLGLDDNTIASILKLLMAYIGGQAIVDVGLALKGSKLK